MVAYTKYRKIYFIISAVLMLTSVLVLILFGLKPSIDFTGGTILEINYKDARPSNQEISSQLTEFNLGSLTVQPAGEKGVIIRMKDISEEVHNQILVKLGKEEGKIEEIRFETIGPTIGKELKGKTNLVVFLALLAMLIYIALAFRRVQKPVKSWQYGISSLIALFHDILIPLGVFAVLGKFYNVEISIPIITALLTVLGYSINNTVVVFDRIRENLLKFGGYFNEIIDKSLNQTLTRQLNTSLTTLFALIAIFFFGGETLKYFSLALIIGILAGMYSSFFIAGPLLLSWSNLTSKSKRK